MNSVFDRIVQLEERVKFLETELQKRNLLGEIPDFQQEKVDFSQIQISNMYQEPMIRVGTSDFLQESIRRESTFQNPLPQRDSMDFSNDRQENVFKNTKNEKYSESLVGKYFIGALASLLIFIGAASFLAMIWNDIGDWVKVGIILASGILLATAGFVMFKKTTTGDPSSTVADIVFSTGSGLIYLALLSSSILFYLVNGLVSLALCLIWSIVLMYLYRYINRFLCMIIAYMGGYISFWLATPVLGEGLNASILFFFILFLSAAMIYMTYRSSKAKYSVVLLAISFLFGSYVLANNVHTSQSDLWSMVSLLILFLLKNLIYHVYNSRMSYKAYLLAGIFFAVVFTFMHFPEYISRDMKLYLFLTLEILQFFLNAAWYQNIASSLNHLYSAVLYLPLMEFMTDKLDITSGASIIVLLAVLARRFWDLKYNNLFIMLFFSIDCLCFFTYESRLMWIFALANLILLWYVIQKETGYTKRVMKYFMLLMFLLNSFFIAQSIVLNMPNLNYVQSDEYSMSITHVLATVFILIAYKIDFMRTQVPMQPLNFKLGKAGNSLNTSSYEEYYYSDYIGVYIYLVLLYFTGLFFLSAVSLMPLKFVLSLSTLIVMMVQLNISVRKFETLEGIAGVWMPLKFLFFVWAVIRSFSDLSVDSLIYSVSGLVIAVISIYVGFKMMIGSIRQFGLAITILMVAKFIFVDLQAENSMTRVLAFVAGGILCFIISVIYNRLSKEIQNRNK